MQGFISNEGFITSQIEKNWIIQSVYIYANAKTTWPTWINKDQMWRLCFIVYTVLQLHVTVALSANKFGCVKVASSTAALWKRTLWRVLLCQLHLSLQQNHTDLRCDHYSTSHLGEVQGFTKRPVNVRRLSGGHLLATHIDVFICANCCMRLGFGESNMFGEQRYNIWLLTTEVHCLFHFLVCFYPLVKYIEWLY